MSTLTEIFCLFYLLSFLAAIISGAERDIGESQKCDSATEQIVSGCLQPMLRFADSVERNNGGMQFAWHGSDIFKRLCTIYQEFKACTENIVCESRTIYAMQASYDYMCGNGYTLFEEYAAYIYPYIYMCTFKFYIFIFIFYINEHCLCLAFSIKCTFFFF
ncbi:unnamed protein product, partial [Enterobius vermicularis]|uniref:DUF19 domain-containing protein n=1 Tax=Enterobius vermicularis TaxID=51028 RepID=A0A0N4VR57_ENTVE